MTNLLADRLTPLKAIVSHSRGRQRSFELRPAKAVKIPLGFESPSASEYSSAFGICLRTAPTACSPSRLLSPPAKALLVRSRAAASLVSMSPAFSI